jgi:cytidylate kinase
MPAMIVTIDGPAGTGKSTVSRLVADRLGFDFLDTGAMYRAVGLEAARREIDLTNRNELVMTARACRISFDWSQKPPRVLLNGDDVTDQLRTDRVTEAASHVAVVDDVRAVLVEQQKRIGAEHPNLVTEGRDQGTVVFPSAAVKFFLDAALEERAKRRFAELRAKRENVDYWKVYHDMEQRDRRDRTRAVAPLKPADDAIVVDTTSLSRDEVVERLVSVARQRLQAVSAR